MKDKINIKDYFSNFLNENLNASFNNYEKRSFLHYLSFYLFNKPLESLFEKTADAINESEKAKLEELVKRLNFGEPIQYICGFAFFHDLILKVNKNVLIPRAETEELAEWVINFCKENNIKDPDILDIGTGSGCIALAIKNKLPDANVSGVDIDIKAIEVAQNNAKELELDVHFECFDILNYLPDKQTELYDIILSNPPYITENEIMSMQESVLTYEPAISLFVTDGDPLQFYKRISAFARQYLKKEGNLFFEINENNGFKMQELMKRFGFNNVALKKDMQNKDRMIRAAF